MPMIEVSGQTYQDLMELGGRMLTPDEAIARLIVAWNDHHTDESAGTARNREDTVYPVLPTRNRRQRGVTVEIEGEKIVAISVKDLYEQVLRKLVDDGVLRKFSNLIPFKTSPARYLISKSAVHPKGNEFFVPVKYEGFYMETHKSYQTAVSQLQTFLGRVGLKFNYLGD